MSLRDKIIEDLPRLLTISAISVVFVNEIYKPIVDAFFARISFLTIEINGKKIQIMKILLHIIFWYAVLEIFVI